MQIEDKNDVCDPSFNRDNIAVESFPPPGKKLSTQKRQNTAYLNHYYQGLRIIMAAREIIQMIERIDRPVKTGSYSSYSGKESGRSKRGAITIHASSGISKKEIESIYQRFEKERQRTVDSVGKEVVVSISIGK